MLRVEYNCKENNYKEIVYATFCIFHVNLECAAFGDEICFSSFADAFAIEWKKNSILPRRLTAGQISTSIHLRLSK